MSGDVEAEVVEHRCPRMSQHFYPGNLPVPCGDCYSVRVVSERIPWEPSGKRGAP